MKNFGFIQKYWKILTILLFVGLIILLLFVIVPSRLSGITKPSGTVSTCPEILKGLEYLQAQIHPDIGLLREAPNAAPNTYWITNDNALAACTFTQLGYFDLGSEVHKAIKQYGEASNDFIEVVWGNTITFPPHIANPIVIKNSESFQILQELHNTGPVFEDWEEYANLGFLSALNSYNQGDEQSARRKVMNTMQLFDGIGFADKSFNGTYETYKLALALYSAKRIGLQLENEQVIFENLLKMQNINGGFHTHYDQNFKSDSDTNTETTSFALLALNLFGCK